jgi:hypothetical protein
MKITAELWNCKNEPNRTKVSPSLSLLHHRAHDSGPLLPYVRSTHNESFLQASLIRQGQESVSSDPGFAENLQLGQAIFTRTPLGCCQRIRASVSNDSVLSRRGRQRETIHCPVPFLAAQLSHSSVFWAQMCSICFFRRKTCSVVLVLSPVALRRASM